MMPWAPWTRLGFLGVGVKEKQGMGEYVPFALRVLLRVFAGRLLGFSGVCLGLARKGGGREMPQKGKGKMGGGEPYACRTVSEDPLLLGSHVFA